MNNLSLNLRANEIHENAQFWHNKAEHNLYRFFLEIKKIRDERLFSELGFSDFDEYCQSAWNLKRRVVDERIQIANSFSEEDFKRYSARLGHKKTLLLTTMNEEQRDQSLNEGVPTERGYKPYDKATQKEIAEYKRNSEEMERKAKEYEKQLKQRDEQNNQLQSQLEQAQRSEEIARKQLEDEQDKEPEVIEKYMEPEDYQSIKNMNEHLQSEREYYKKQADDFRNEVKNIMDQPNKPTENNRGDNNEDYTPTLIQLLKPAKEFINYYSDNIENEKALNELEKIKNILKEK